MPANPYTSLTAGPSMLGREQAALVANPELVGLERQRKMAELLLAQGLKGQPEGQMVSGYYVAPSWAQRLSPVLDRLMGEQGLKDVDEKTSKLAEMLRQRDVEQTNQVFDQMFGAPARYVPQGDPLAGEMITPAVQANPQAALRSALLSESPMAQRMLPIISQQAIPQQITPYQQAQLDLENKKLTTITPYQQAQLDLEQQKLRKDNIENIAFNNNGMPVGRFDKQGRYISPQGRVYNASAVNEAQKEHDVAMDLAYKLNQLTDKDIKNAFGSLVDYTASKTGQMLGRKEVVTAQNKINSIQIKNVLDNLSQLKGASSDKEMAQMIKDFPAYTADPEVMEKWVERAAKTTNRFLKRTESRFGFDTEYAVEGRFGEKDKSKQTNVPAGIDPAVWNVMTPQERALWQK